MLDDAVKTRLRPWMAETLGAPDLTVEAIEPMGGGSIQENWRVRCRPDVGGTVREFVLRKDAPAVIASSRTRGEEFKILEVAHAGASSLLRPLAFARTWT